MDALASILTVEFAKDYGILECGPFVLKIDPTLSKKSCINHLVVSNSLQPHGLYLPGSSSHGIRQARILEWVAISFSRGSSRLRDRTQVSCTACRGFNR